MRRTIIASLLALTSPLIAVPASYAQTPPVAPPGSVTLPLTDYDKLIERASHPPVVPELPPVAAVVGRADVQVRLSAADVRGTATLQGEVLRSGRVKVPLLDGTTLLEVLQNGTAVPVVTEAGTVNAILSGPSPFTLTVSFGGDVTTEPGRASAVLPAIRAGTVRAVIEAPGDNVDIRVDAGLLRSRTSADGKTRVEAALTPRQSARITWSSRDQAVKAPREVRVVSDVKSLVTVAEGDLRLASLFDVNVLVGQPDQLEVQVPDGFDVVSVSGGYVESSGQQGNRLLVTLREPARRRHQFLVTLERNAANGAPQHTELAVPGVQAVQRETGEIAWEAIGTVDLTAAEAGPLRRLDVSEVNASLTSLARSPLLTAFRYQRRGVERVPVTFDVRRFPDAPVLGALAENATVTTVVSAEGRALTEFALLVRNRGQLFLKVDLPKGATLLSAEVGGQLVKPVEAPDGARVPLVRPGYQPSSIYGVSFVYVEAGTSFDKKGQAEMKLPRLDVPIDILSWELFLPDRYKVKRFEGDALPETLFIPIAAEKKQAEAPSAAFTRTGTLRADQVGGVVVDSSGAVIPGAVVTIVVGGHRRSAVTTASGTFLFSDVPAGRVQITAALQGFRTFTTTLAAPGVSIRVPLVVGTLAETVQATAQTQTLKESQAPSQNVLNLKERLSGVLPVRIDVPRSGQAFRFIRPLVFQEETVVRFEYKTK